MKVQHRASQKIPTNRTASESIHELLEQKIEKKEDYMEVKPEHEQKQEQPEKNKDRNNNKSKNQNQNNSKNENKKNSRTKTRKTDQQLQILALVLRGSSAIEIDTGDNHKARTHVVQCLHAGEALLHRLRDHVGKYPAKQVGNIRNKG